MTLRSEKSAWKRALLTATAAATIAGSAIQPAEADETRHCNVWLEVRAAGTNTNVGGSYRWTVHKTVTYLTQVNEARREAKRAAITCMRTHWEARDANAAPDACQSHGSLEFRNYPFVNLAEQLRHDVCAARPDELRQDVDLVLFIDGKRGCVEYEVGVGCINCVTRRDIASSYRINCPSPPPAAAGHCPAGKRHQPQRDSGPALAGLRADVSGHSRLSGLDLPAGGHIGARIARALFPEERGGDAGLRQLLRLGDQTLGGSKGVCCREVAALPKSLAPHRPR